MDLNCIVTLPIEPSDFSDAEKRECCLMISVGCDRETACNFLGKTAGELRLALQQDGEFHKQILRAEATPEFNHMRNLYNAAKDEKHWRASVWWLERRSPERFARRTPNTLTASQLRQIIEELAESIVGEVKDLEDQRRLLDKLVQIAQKVQDDSFRSDEAQHSTAKETLAKEQNHDDETKEPS